MASSIAQESLSKEEREAWESILEKRRPEWAQLNPSVLDGIISLPWSNLTAQPPLLSSKEKLDWLISKYFARSVDTKVAPSERRYAWLLVKKLLEKSDQAWRQHKNNQEELALIDLETPSSNTLNLATSNTVINSQNTDLSGTTQFRTTDIRLPEGGETTPLSATQAAAKPPPPSSASNVALRSTTTAAASVSANPASSETNVEAAGRSSLVDSTTLAATTSHRLPETHSYVRIKHDKSSPTDKLPSSSVPIKSIIATNQKLNGKHFANSSQSYMGAAQSSASAFFVAPTNGSHQHHMSKPHEKKVAETPPPRLPPSSRVCTPDLVSHPVQNLSSSPVTIYFPRDDNKYYGGLTARPIIKTVHKPQTMTEEAMKQVNSRLATWDPYWKMEEILVLQQTCPLDSCDLRKDSEVPVHRVVSCKFSLTLDQMAQVSGWGIPRGNKQYEQGETRLIIRMLPILEPERTAEKGKKARADFHIWPKGTLLSICGAATQINQRKQQAHNKEYWQGLSYFLDATSNVIPDLRMRPEISIDACCFENKPYALCIAICKFQTPKVLFENLMTKAIDMLPMRLALQNARQMTAQNMVVLDEAEDEGQNGSFIFKLTCALSSSLMRTPVRSKRCKHFQCFDLENFLQMNQHVSGTRWECPVCNNELISAYELEHCALTQRLLDQYKDVASAQRDRVEFFADGTWKLLVEKGKRYGKVQGKDNETHSNAAKRAKVVEVIDLL
jgi:hypothetical protein